jgi:hemerythrin superfamily protein
MNATELLEKQHRKVEAIFSKLEDEEKLSDAKELVEELANDLAAHMTIEQELFYPAVRAVDSELVAESFEEHALAEVALKRLLTSASPEAFKARVTALKELIQHHVEEEEEELFPKVDKTLDDDKLEELGEQMETLFERVVAAGYKKVIPKGLIATSADTSQQKKKKAAPRTKKASTARRRSAA